MTRFRTTVYSLPVINITGNGLVEIVDPEDEYNVLVVMDVDEAEIFSDELKAIVHAALENRREYIQERRY